MAVEYLASNEFPGDGIRTDWDVSFKGNRPDAANGTVPYLTPADVRAQEITPATPTQVEIVVDRTCVQIGPNKFRVSPAVPVGHILRIYRQTQTDYNLVDYQAKQIVSEADLDVANRQLIFVMQETQDIAQRASVVAGETSAAAAAAIQAAEDAQASADYAEDQALRFVGNSASPPTTRVNGDPLEYGDRYLNTGDGIEYIWKGSSWVANNVDGQNLSDPGGSALVGRPSGTVGSSLDKLEADKKFSGVAVVSGVLTLNRTTYGNYSVVLTSDVDSLVLNGAVSGVRSDIVVQFIQGGVGGWWVTIPTNVRMPERELSLVGPGVGDRSVVQFTTTDNGATWDAVILQRFTNSLQKLPPISGDNSTFNDELTNNAGWTLTNCTFAQVGGYERMTKTVAAGTSCNVEKTIVMPEANEDFLFYIKARARLNGDTKAVIGMVNGLYECNLWFNTPDRSLTTTVGTLSFSAGDGVSTSRYFATMGTDMGFEVTAVEVCLHYDSKYETLSAYLKEADGRWKFKGRVKSKWFNYTTITMAIGSSSASGAWVEADYLTICRPNIMAIGDSICAGSPGFNPNPALGLTNDESTWMRGFNGYPSYRNSLVVNKGVGGQTSAQMRDRFQNDILDSKPAVVFIHASSNDFNAGVSMESRSALVQQMIDMATTVGTKVILLNAMYSTSTYSGNVSGGAHRKYCRNWWSNDMLRLHDITAYYNIMQPVWVSNSNQYMDPAKTQADGIHPTPTGYNLIGQYIST